MAPQHGENYGASQAADLQELVPPYSQLSCAGIVPLHRERLVATGRTAQLGICKVAPLWPQRVQRADLHSMSFDVSGERYRRNAGLVRSYCLAPKPN